MIRTSTIVVLLLLAGCSARIQHGLDEEQANEIQTLLVESGFAAQKILEPGKKPTWAIELPEDQAVPATRVLSELGLPRPRLKGFEGMEMGLVPTPTQERLAHLNALSEELSQTLEAVTGVTVARVHLVVPQATRPGQPAGQAKASAFLRVRPGHGSRVRGMDEELRRLVAGSVEGLSPDDVSLVVNEVVSSVPSPRAGQGPAARLRVLVIALGSLVSMLALGLVSLALRLRTAQVTTRQPRAPDSPPATRPVVNAATGRKAA